MADASPRLLQHVARTLQEKTPGRDAVKSCEIFPKNVAGIGVRILLRGRDGGEKKIYHFFAQNIASHPPISREVFERGVVASGDVTKLLCERARILLQDARSCKSCEESERGETKRRTIL